MTVGHHKDFWGDLWLAQQDVFMAVGNPRNLNGYLKILKCKNHVYIYIIRIYIYGKIKKITNLNS